MRSNSVLTRLLLAAAILMPVVAQAKSFVVDQATDESITDSPLLPTTPIGGCPSTAGTLTTSAQRCTLRAAIEQIQAGSDATNTITIAVPGIAVTAALPTITKSVTISGPAPSSTSTVVNIGRFASAPTLPSGTPAGQYCAATSTNATANYRLFNVAPTSGAITVGFQNLALCYGNVVAASGATPDLSNSGGAISVTGAGSVTLTLNTVSVSSSAANFGGAVAIAGAGAKAVQITNTILGANAASVGGALYYSPGLNSSLQIANARLNDNTSGSGGAVYVTGLANVSQNVQIKDSLIDTNTSSAAGGAIAFSPLAASTLNINNVRLLNNLAVSGGAVFANAAPHSVVINNSSLSGNTATASSGAGGVGGAVYADLQFASGTTPSPTPGTLNIIASTVGPYFAGSAASALSPSIADGNSASVGGGGIFLGDTQLVLERSFVVANSAPAGSALLFNGSTPRPATLIGNTIARNKQTASDAGAAAIFVATSGVLTASDSAPFVGNIVAENFDAASADRGCTLPIATTIANTGGYNLFGGTTCASTVLVENKFPAAGSAIFWNTAAGYITSSAGGSIGGFVSRGLQPTVLPLVAESAAIDVVQSDKILSNNRDRDQRGAGIADGNADGTAIKDIGAYEFGSLGLVGFGSASGYTITEPATGDASAPISVQNFSSTAVPATPGLQAPTIRTVDLSQTAKPAAINPGTALPDVSGTQRDYAPVSTTTLTIAGGASNTATSVVVHSDKETEPAETVKLLLDGLYNVDYDALTTTSTSFCLQPGGVRYYPCVTQNLTILDSGAQSGFQFQIATKTVTEGGTTSTPLQVFRVGPADKAATVTCFTSSSAAVGAATPGSDYTIIDPATGSPVSELVLNFPAGATSAVCPVYAYADSIVEPDETFTVGLRDPSIGTILAANTVTVTIPANGAADTTFRLDAAAYSVSEKAGSLQVTVIKSGPSNVAGSVQVLTQSGTAVSGTDFQGVSQTLQWAAGDLNPKTVAIPIIDNTIIDPTTRQFTVRLVPSSAIAGSGTVAVASPDSGQVTIIDDEAQADSVNVAVSKTSVVINGAGSDSYTVTLSASPTRDVVIDLSLPTSSGAFLSTPQLRFLAGTTTLTQTVTVTSAGDPGVGITKTGSITQTLTSSDVRYSTKVLAPIPVQVVGTSANNTIGVSTNAIAITGSGSSTYTIALNTVPTQAVTVSFSVTGSSNVLATAGGLNSVTFQAGNPNLVRTVTVLSSNNPGVDATGTPKVVTSMIQNVVSTSDPAYVGKTIAPITVTVTGTPQSGPGGSSDSSSGGGAFGWSSLLVLGSALLMRRRRRAV